MCIDVLGHLNTRKGRGLDTFAKYPQYRMTLPRPIIPPKGYPLKPRTLGEHIRKRRLDLGLLQIDVAAEIGVTESTVWNWEHGTEPELIHIPTVLAFLGYVPWECPDDPLGRLAHFKKVNGLSLRRLGALMGRDHEQLEDWLSGRVKPGAINIRKIEDFLASFLGAE
ncbi:MAG: helix-turn-helix transcriptional regulator [Nitrospirota bacterium]